MEDALREGCSEEFSPCGSVVEHSLGKGEVAGPIPAKGTTIQVRGFDDAPLVIVIVSYFSESKNGKG